MCRLRKSEVTFAPIQANSDPLRLRTGKKILSNVVEKARIA